MRRLLIPVFVAALMVLSGSSIALSQNTIVHFGLVQGLLGLVIQEVHSSLPGFTDKALNFGIVVPAAFIRETIEMLPPPKP
jgi:hypothetical protein